MLRFSADHPVSSILLLRHLYNGPATVKSSKCNIDQRSGSSGPEFARNSAQKLAGKVAGDRCAGPSHFPGQLLGRFSIEIRPGLATYLIDFTLK